MVSVVIFDVCNIRNDFYFSQCVKIFICQYFMIILHSVYGVSRTEWHEPVDACILFSSFIQS